jgi:hypothetical protein
MSPSEGRMLRWRGGGWLLALGILLAIGAGAWRLMSLVTADRPAPVGDGRYVQTYQFDLSTCLVPRRTLVASGLPRDGIVRLDYPDFLSVDEADGLSPGGRGKYLVPSDRVIGVSLHGHHRAYPLRVLVWHEVVNDTLAGRPLLVTYSPLCDAVVAFDRRVDGETLEFGVSGLLSNSNPLYYDLPGPRRPVESLWSQLQARAVAGPAAERRLRLETVPAQVVHWSVWKSRHPATEVLAPHPGYGDEYRREPYGSYFGSDLLRFPVNPRPHLGGPSVKDPVAIVQVNGDRMVFPLDAIAERAAPADTLTVALGGVPLFFEYAGSPPAVHVSAPPGSGQPEVLIHAFWFAWYATRPNDPVFGY